MYIIPLPLPLTTPMIATGEQWKSPGLCFTINIPHLSYLQMVFIKGIVYKLQTVGPSIFRVTTQLRHHSSTSLFHLKIIFTSILCVWYFICMCITCVLKQQKPEEGSDALVLQFRGGWECRESSPTVLSLLCWESFITLPILALNSRPPCFSFLSLGLQMSDITSGSSSHFPGLLLFSTYIFLTNY